VCGKKNCAITDEGGVRHHLTDDPAQQAGPDSRKCKGVGQPPQGAAPAAGDVRFLCRVPSGPEGCGHQVQLTANRRARSHLTPQGTPCAEGGSAWPIAVGPEGFRQDTAEWTEEQWAQALPKPVRGGEILPAAAPEDLRIEPDRDFDPRPVQDVDLPHDRQPDPHRAEAERIQREQDADYEQALRDGLEESRSPGQQAEDYRSRMDRVQSGSTTVFDPTHTVTTDLGTEIHPGEAGGCRLPGCCTHPSGFEYGDDDNGHSGSFCPVCGTEEPEPCRHDYVAWDDLDDDGQERIVWACKYCREVEPEAVTRMRSHSRARDILSNLDEGVLFVRHTARPPLNELVYRLAEHESSTAVTATIVSAGPYAGRTGSLTNLTEEITCTDLNGTPRPRRDRGTGATSPSSPGPLPSSTLSPSARTGQSGPQGGTSSPTPTPAVSGPGSTHGTRVSAPGAGASSTKETASGPTAKAGTSARTAAGTTARKSPVPDAFSTPKQTASESDKYDRYGRYKMLHPVTGKPVNWTRATTFAKSIQDTFALSQWAQRMTLKGAALRPDIVAAVSTLDVKQDKDRVNTLVEDAKKAAGNKVAANLGTAVHSFTEDRDKALVGMPVQAKAIPDDLRPTVDAYELLLRDFGLEPVPGLIEFSTGVVQYEIAGTSDRCYRVTRDITFKINKRTVTLYSGEYVIGDVKTGADLSYGWMEICIQLAIYAQGLNTSGVWDWNTRTWGKPTLPDNPDVLLKVRTDVALVPHLPVDRKEGADLATLFAIDLDAGWAAAVLCEQVRATRKKGNLATPLTVADVEETPEPSNEPMQRAAARAREVITSRPVTLEDKARIVTTQEAASAVWKEAVAARTPKAEVDRLVQIMKDRLDSLVEKGA
jgi:hypothetical protein